MTSLSATGVGLQLIKECGLEPQQVCYIGDDLSDLRLLAQVGLAVTVADGAPEVKELAHLTTKTAGGKGAMRELIETILKAKLRWEDLVRSFE